MFDQQKLLDLSTDFDPFPLLKQMDASMLAQPKSPLAAAGFAPGEWDWMHPNSDQSGQQQQQPGGAPLTPQQMAVLSTMMPKMPDPKFIGGAAPSSGAGIRANITPITPGALGLTQGANAKNAPSLAAILSGRM